MEIYHNSYGWQACIRVAKSRGARLTVRDENSELVHGKDYSSRADAVHAMNCISDSWKNRFD